MSKSFTITVDHDERPDEVARKFVDVLRKIGVLVVDQTRDHDTHVTYEITAFGVTLNETDKTSVSSPNTTVRNGLLDMRRA